MGFSALETWGGATIDAGLRFLKEWPFDRLDALKKAAPKLSLIHILSNLAAEWLTASREKRSMSSCGAKISVSSLGDQPRRARKFLTPFGRKPSSG